MTSIRTKIALLIAWSVILSILIYIWTHSIYSHPFLETRFIYVIKDASTRLSPEVITLVRQEIERDQNHNEELSTSILFQCEKSILVYHNLSSGVMMDTYDLFRDIYLSYPILFHRKNTQIHVVVDNIRYKDKELFKHAPIDGTYSRQSQYEDMILLYQHLHSQSMLYQVNRVSDLSIILFSDVMTTSRSVNSSFYSMLQCPRISMIPIIKSYKRSYNLSNSWDYISSISNPMYRCIEILNTRRYDRECMPKPEILYPLLITGLGGSGTHHISNLLRAMSIDVLHEAMGSDTRNTSIEGMGRHGSVGWLYAVNDIIGTIPYLYNWLKNYIKHKSLYTTDSVKTYEYIIRPRLWSPRYEHITYLVRCPLKQISTLTSHLDQTFKFIRMHMMRDMDKYEILREYKHLVKDTGKICQRNSECNLPIAMLSWIYWTTRLALTSTVLFHTENTSSIANYLCSRFVEREYSILPDAIAANRKMVNSNNSILSDSLISCEYYLKISNQRDRIDVLDKLSNRISLALQCRKIHQKKLPKSVECFGKNQHKKYMGIEYRESSRGHRLHREYNLSDLIKVDSYLASYIVNYSKVLGYNYLC